MSWRSGRGLVRLSSGLVLPLVLTAAFVVGEEVLALSLSVDHLRTLTHKHETLHRAPYLRQKMRDITYLGNNKLPIYAHDVFIYCHCPKPKSQSFSRSLSAEAFRKAVFK